MARAGDPLATPSHRGVAGERQQAPLLERQDIRALERLSVASLDTILAGLVGERAGPGQAAGFEFSDYRRYTPGDNVSRIDWSIYARLHELHVRTSPQEAGVRLSVLLDASRSMDSGEPSKLHYGRRLAALLGAVALLRRDALEVNLLSDGDSVSSGSFDSGAGALGALVDELERLPAGRTTELARSIRRAGKSGWQPQLAVLISDGLQASDELAAALAELARGARSAALVHVRDPADALGRWDGSTLLRDSETGRELDATLTAAVWDSYAARYARWCAQIEAQCRASGLHYVNADASRDPLELLIATARTRSLVRTAPPS
jgi:uncharacterized protein (DUF58 family)